MSLTGAIVGAVAFAQSNRPKPLQSALERLIVIAGNLSHFVEAAVFNIFNPILQFDGDVTGDRREILLSFARQDDTIEHSVYGTPYWCTVKVSNEPRSLAASKSANLRGNLCALGRIRTYDTRLRRPILYPAELRALASCTLLNHGLAEKPASKADTLSRLL